MENISIDELHNRFSGMDENELILDVRSPEEYAAGHIPNAMNTPHDEVASIVEDLRQYKTVYVHCKMGGRAQMAAQTLRDSGLTNVTCINKGGMQRWLEQGWPNEK